MDTTLTPNHASATSQECAADLAKLVAERMATLDCGTARPNGDGSYTLMRGQEYDELVIAPDADTGQVGEVGVAITDGAEPDPSGRRTVWLWKSEIEHDLHDACMGAFDRLQTKRNLRKEWTL